MISSVKEIKKGGHIHLMGICGTAMGSLAGILKSQGYRVTGSDENVYPPMSTQLEQLNINIQKEFKAENLYPHPDYVVVGNVITRHMPETQELLKLDLPYGSLPQVLGELFLKERESVVCCGTHGKTTTTSMMAWALETLGQNPGYLVGGVPLNFDYSFSARESKWFVIEGDEYDTAFFDKVPKFVHYHPKNVILTGIEFDHIDIYDSLEDVKKAFAKLIQATDPSGVMVYNGEDQVIQELLGSIEHSFWTLSYGQSDQNHSALLEERLTEHGTELLCKVGDREFEFFGNWFGTYNSLNFLSALTLLDFKGENIDKVIESAETFKGVARRQQELLATPNLKIYEDFAHHPSAVKLTIDSFKKRFSDHNLIAIFEPRSATSRRSVFQKNYVESFLNADVSILAPVAKKSEKDTFSSEKLCSDLISKGKTALSPETLDHVLTEVQKNLTGKDMILFMSNGGFGGIMKQAVELFSKGGL